MKLPQELTDIRLICAISGARTPPADDVPEEFEDEAFVPPPGWVKITFQAIVPNADRAHALQLADAHARNSIEAQRAGIEADPQFQAMTPEQKQQQLTAAHKQLMDAALEEMEQLDTEDFVAVERVIHVSPDGWSKLATVLTEAGVTLE